MVKKYKLICGHTKEINYDDKIKKINLELAYDNIGTPIIIFGDWTNKGKDLFTLHIKEAVELKSIIDNLIIDYHENEIEELKATHL